MSDYFNRSEKFHKTKLLIEKSLTIVSQYSDIFKDIYLLSILLKINGGLKTLLFPWKFSSIIIICFGTTIVCPLLISSIQLAISNPGLIFNSRRKNRWSVRLMRVGVILTCFINPIILKVTHENIQEKIRKYSQTSDPSEALIYLVNKKKEVKNTLSRLLKVDLGLELIFQISLLILGLLSISTSTAKFLWAAQDKRLKKIKKGTNGNLQEPLGTFRICMQATVTACKLLWLHARYWNCMQATETACKLL